MSNVQNLGSLTGCETVLNLLKAVYVRLKDACSMRITVGGIMVNDGDSPPVDIDCAMMFVWRIRRKIIRTVLCCVV